MLLNCIYAYNEAIKFGGVYGDQNSQRCAPAQGDHFFGLSARQFLCSLSAVGIAVAVYLGLSALPAGDRRWACILSAAPVAAAGFFQYNGLTLEQFVWAVLRSQVLCAGKRVFCAENIYYKALGRREDKDFDQDPYRRK